MVYIAAIDYLHLIVIYIACTLIRAGLLFSARPILTMLGKDNQEVTLADCAVMTWGGLRGAVGLALAIQVRINQAENDNGVKQISDMDGKRVLFYVGGIAAMTLCINAVTCPALVRKL